MRWHALGALLLVAGCIQPAIEAGSASTAGATMPEPSDADPHLVLAAPQGNSSFSLSIAIGEAGARFEAQLVPAARPSAVTLHVFEERSGTLVWQLSSHAPADAGPRKVDFDAGRYVVLIAVHAAEAGELRVDAGVAAPELQVLGVGSADVSMHHVWQQRGEQMFSLGVDAATTSHAIGPAEKQEMALRSEHPARELETVSIAFAAVASDVSVGAATVDRAAYDRRTSERQVIASPLFIVNTLAVASGIGATGFGLTLSDVEVETLLYYDHVTMDLPSQFEVEPFPPRGASVQLIDGTLCAHAGRIPCR